MLRAVPEPRPEPDVPAAGAPARQPASVEELFARLRAGRASATAATAGAVPPSPAPPTRGPAERGDHSDDDEAPERSPVPSVAEARLRDERDAALEPLGTQLLRKLKRAVQDDQNATLDRLRTARGRLDPAAVLSSADEQRARFGEVAATFLDQAARAATGEDAARVDVDDLAAQLAADLVEPLRARLGQVMAEARAEDVDAAALGERMSSVFREWKSQRTEHLADHFLVAAHARGVMAATSDEAVFTWVVDDRGRPCPDCDDNALAGPTRKGEPFPTGQVHPPAHVGCRCLLAPPSI